MMKIFYYSRPYGKSSSRPISIIFIIDGMHRRLLKIIETLRHAFGRDPGSNIVKNLGPGQRLARATTWVVTRNWSLVLLLTLVLCSSSTNMGILLSAENPLQRPAFPGAEGYGALATGGRGGRVIKVTNLQDSGPGSFREAVENSSGPRIVVFAVNGLIPLQKSVVIKSGDITIAGQTSRGSGITLQSDPALFNPPAKQNSALNVSTSNVIVRFLKIRPGLYTNDALVIDGNAGPLADIIIDHCSFSWTHDENISVFGVHPVQRMTLQWNLVAEGLSPHSCGLLMYGWGEDPFCNAELYLNKKEIDLHHNLFFSNINRNPQMATGGSRFINNLVANWERAASHSSAGAVIDYINNYFLPGPLTAERYTGPIKHEHHPFNDSGKKCCQWNEPSLYVKGNYHPTLLSNENADNWPAVRAINQNSSCTRFLEGALLPQSFQRPSSSPLPESTIPVSIQKATLIKEPILQNVGAHSFIDDKGSWVWSRDTADTRMVEDIRNGEGKLVSSPADVGGYPSGPNEGGYPDADQDGMPDVYELSKGFNPHSSQDASEDFNGNGYTNIEDYFNGGEESHPNLFFTKESIGTIYKRLEDSYFQACFKKISDAAKTKLSVDYSLTTSTEFNKGQDARILAFCALFMNKSDPYYIQIASQARSALLHFNDGLWSAQPNNPKGSNRYAWDGSTEVHFWYPGGVLFDYVMAYDWLVGAGELTGTERQKVRSRLLLFAAAEREKMWSPLRPANGRFRSLGGLGLAALAFPGQQGLVSDPENLLPGKPVYLSSGELLDYVLHDAFIKDESNDSVQGTVANYVARDGAYLEGAAYQDESFYTFLPFLLAYQNRTGISYLQNSSLFDDRIVKMYEWNVKALMPNKVGPPFNTGFIDKVVGHDIIEPYATHPEWHAWYQTNVVSGGSIEKILFRHSPPTTPPPPALRTEFLPESGYAIFRDKWGTDGTYLALTARHFPACRSGHVQSDQASFIIYAKESFLAIDPGDGRAYLADNNGDYLGSKENWIHSGFGHNLITVDSTYTPSSSIDYRRTNCHPRTISSCSSVVDPAYLKNTFAHENADYAEVHLSYSQVLVDLVRSVVFPRHQYFIIEDNLTSTTTHQYTWQIHFGDNSQTGNLLNQGNRYSWTQANAKQTKSTLDVAFLQGPTSIDVKMDGATGFYGATYPDDIFDHTYLRALAAGDNKSYLTLLYPRYASDPGLKISELVSQRAWKITGSFPGYDLLIKQTSPSVLAVDRVVTNALFLLASFEGGSVPPLRSVLAKGGTDIKILGDKTYIFSPTPETVFYVEPTGGIDDPPPITPPSNSLPLSILVSPTVLSPVEGNSIRIHYSRDIASPIKIEVLSRDGSIVNTLLSADVGDTAGDVFWDGKNNGGSLVASGTYLIRCQDDSQSIVKKVVVVK